MTHFENKELIENGVDQMLNGLEETSTNINRLKNIFSDNTDQALLIFDKNL